LETLFFFPSINSFISPKMETPFPQKNLPNRSKFFLSVLWLSYVRNENRLRIRLIVKLSLLAPKSNLFYWIYEIHTLIENNLKQSEFLKIFIHKNHKQLILGALSCSQMQFPIQYLPEFEKSQISTFSKIRIRIRFNLLGYKVRI